MTDRELLELAAKAAGYGEVWSLDGYPDTFYIGPRYMGGDAQYRVWNPLIDDGDALRLAVKLQIDVNHGDVIVVAERVWPAEVGVAEPKQSDPYAATRRAIVRAAAEIGRAMS